VVEAKVTAAAVDLTPVEANRAAQLEVVARQRPLVVPAVLEVNLRSGRLQLGEGRGRLPVVLGEVAVETEGVVLREVLQSSRGLIEGVVELGFESVREAVVTQDGFVGGGKPREQSGHRMVNDRAMGQPRVDFDGLVVVDATPQVREGQGTVRMG